MTDSTIRKKSQSMLCDGHIIVRLKSHTELTIDD